MIIQVDQEGGDVVSKLCDLALKQGGVKNLNQVNRILKSVKLLPTPKDIEQGTNQLKSPKKEDEAAGQKVVEKQEASKEVKEEKQEEPLKEEVKLEEAAENGVVGEE